MNTSFQEHLRIDLRLVLLRLLIEAGGSANAAVLQVGAAGLGHRASREQVEQELVYLASLGAVRLDAELKPVTVAHLTRRGHDHVERIGPPLVGVSQPSL